MSINLKHASAILRLGVGRFLWIVGLLTWIDHYCDPRLVVISRVLAAAGVWELYFRARSGYWAMSDLWMSTQSVWRKYYQMLADSIVTAVSL